MFLSFTKLQELAGMVHDSSAIMGKYYFELDFVKLYWYISFLSIILK